MKKSNIIVLALSTLLVVCNALPMNNHVKKQKRSSYFTKRGIKKEIKEKRCDWQHFDCTALD